MSTEMEDKRTSSDAFEDPNNKSQSAVMTLSLISDKANRRACSQLEMDSVLADVCLDVSQLLNPTHTIK